MSSMDKWFFDQAQLGNMYQASSTGAVTLSTVSATCTGLVISNTWGSGKLVVMKSVSFQPSTAPAGAAVVGLNINASVVPTAITHTTPIVIHNALSLGSNTNTGVAKVDSAATLPAAPVWLRAMGCVVAASSIAPAKYKEEINGSIILSPGSYLSLSYLTTAAVGIASCEWAEIDE